MHKLCWIQDHLTCKMILEVEITEFLTEKMFLFRCLRLPSMSFFLRSNWCEIFLHMLNMLNFSSRCQNIVCSFNTKKLNGISCEISNCNEASILANWPKEKLQIFPIEFITRWLRRMLTGEAFLVWKGEHKMLAELLSFCTQSNCEFAPNITLALLNNCDIRYSPGSRD